MSDSESLLSYVGFATNSCTSNPELFSENIGNFEFNVEFI